VHITACNTAKFFAHSALTPAVGSGKLSFTAKLITIEIMRLDLCIEGSHRMGDSWHTACIGTTRLLRRFTILRTVEETRRRATGLVLNHQMVAATSRNEKPGQPARFSLLHHYIF